jgi:hypothetical protein
LRGSTFEEGVPVVYWPFPVVIVLSVAGVPTCWLPVMVPVTDWLPDAPSPLADSPLAAIVAVAAPVVSSAARPRRRKVFVIDFSHSLKSDHRNATTDDALREYTTMGPTYIHRHDDLSAEFAD